MKILHVLDGYGSSTGHSTRYIIEGMQKLGHNLEVYTSNVKLSIFDSKNEESKVSVTRFKGFKFFKKAIFPGVIFKILFRKNPDIVHTHVMGFFSTFVTGYLKLIKKYKLVLFADIDVDNIPKPNLFYKFYYYLFIRKPAELCDAITVFTEDQKKELSKRIKINPEKIYIIPSGVDNNLFKKYINKKNIRNNLNFRNKFIILNVSSIVRKRRLEIILNVINKIKIKNVLFIHVGKVIDKDYYNELKNLIKKLKIKDKVRFEGELTLKEIIPYYLSSDIYLMTSRNESFGIPMLESMAAGLPVLTTNTGAAKDLVINEVNGFIVEESYKDIIKKIEILYSNEKLRKIMSKKCKETALKYDWNIINKKIEKIYIKLQNDKK